MNKLYFGILVSTIFCLPAYASEYVPCAENETGTCWSCGETCSARLTYDNEQDALNKRNATLTFSGTGNMYNYESPTNNPELIGVEPWYGVRNVIKKAVVEDGITSVGNRTIYQMEKLTDVSLPETITSIGHYAFYWAKKLENLEIPENVKSIGYFAFLSTKINEIVIPPSVTSMHTKAFSCEDGSPEDCVALPLTKIYCTSNNAQACASAVAHLGITPTIYEKTENGDFYYNGKWYQNPNDILSGQYIKKRIYTVEEATTVTNGNKNTFSIRYR